MSAPHVADTVLFYENNEGADQFLYIWTACYNTILSYVCLKEYKNLS